MEYRSKEELEANVLALGDVVIFNLKGVTYKYKVRGCFLASTIGRLDAIFSNLDLKKHAFATEAYGYPGNEGIWPEYRDRDYEAATRLVIALYEEIEKQESEPKPTKMTKTQRIEALEAQVAELTKLMSASKESSDEDITEVEYEEPKPKFDPEKPTFENMPEVWLAKLVDESRVAVDFVTNKDDSNIPVKSTQDTWYSVDEITLIPYSQWPKLIVDHYNEHREALELPELPTF